MNPRYFSAKFCTSVRRLSDSPAALMEVAFAGRSNAGKSSAINTITRNGKLARTSKTPGRTQLINHFALPQQRFLVDLPGYGYAKVSRRQLDDWHRFLQQYLTEREPLVGVVLVMDIRHPLTDNDWQLIELQQMGHSDLHVLLTKADKLSRGKVMQTLQWTRRELELAGVAATLQDFSSLRPGESLHDVHGILDGWLYADDDPTENESSASPGPLLLN